MRTMRALILAVVVLSLLPSLSRGAEERSSAASGARKQIADAQAELTKAQQALLAKKAELRAEAEKTDEWAAALEAQKKAKDELDAAGKPVIEALATKSDYQKLLAEKKAAEERKETLRLANAGPDKVFDATSKVVSVQLAIKKLEEEALAADPKVAEAKKKHTEATAAVTAIQRKFEESLKENADYKAAQDAVTAAQDKVKTARQTAADATRQERESRRSSRESSRDSNNRDSSRESRRNRNNN